ncbi:MAG: homocysteine S-methyltransferase [Xanthomonadales bacterium]|nr:homocysteine S-methyltransferase [Xanthomonadales bacterium]
MNPLKPFFDKQGFAMLDGGLSTQLELNGADLSGALWTTRVLIDQPALVVDAQRQFLEAGADVIATATYQASTAGLVRAGLGHDEAGRLMRGAVGLAVDARDEFWSEPENRAGRLRPLVAASLGPYGACQHDGSEYHGNYTLDKVALADFHRPRIEILANCGADLFAFETFPSLLEAEAVIELLEDFPDIHAWVSFSCRDGLHVAHGETFADCAALVESSSQVVAVGVNCLAPGIVSLLLESVRHIEMPLAVYPNSGEYWNAELQQWMGQACDSMDVVAWHRLGARLIGGCCRTSAEDIRGMRSRLEGAISGSCKSVLEKRNIG